MKSPRRLRPAPCGGIPRAVVSRIAGAPHRATHRGACVWGAHARAEAAHGRRVRLGRV